MLGLCRRSVLMKSWIRIFRRDVMETCWFLQIKWNSDFRVLDSLKFIRVSFW